MKSRARLTPPVTHEVQPQGGFTPETLTLCAGTCQHTVTEGKAVLGLFSRGRRAGCLESLNSEGQSSSNERPVRKGSKRRRGSASPLLSGDVHPDRRWCAQDIRDQRQESLHNKFQGGAASLHVTGKQSIRSLLSVLSFPPAAPSLTPSPWG